MTKFLVFLFVVWILARLAKRWLLGKAQKMQQAEVRRRAEEERQMSADMMDSCLRLLCAVCLNRDFCVANCTIHLQV